MEEFKNNWVVQTLKLREDTKENRLKMARYLGLSQDKLEQLFIDTLLEKINKSRQKWVNDGKINLTNNYNRIDEILAKIK